MATCVHLLHLVQIISASVVNVMAEGSSKHGKGFKIRVVFLQFSCLKNIYIYTNLFTWINTSAWYVQWGLPAMGKRIWCGFRAS